MENKKQYRTPLVETITLDNDISLALQSVAPPEGPGESVLTPTFMQNDPFKNQLG